MNNATRAIANAIKSANVSNEARVEMGKALFATLTDKRAKLEDFLGACGCYRIKNNMMSGKEIHVAYGTPIYCDPSSETYWSM